MFYRLLTKQRLRSGSCAHIARAWLLSLLYEHRRIIAWRARHDPDTGKRNSWRDAWRATGENSPRFDRLWDDEFEQLTGDR